MKSIIRIVGVIFVITHMAGAVEVMKKGFVTYSEGDGGERKLMYRSIVDGNLGTPENIVVKGSAGGDQQGAISFDGKWIGFIRKREPKCEKMGSQWNGNGEDDYHKSHCFGVFVARLDGSFPTEAIKVADEGYWPSWGDDSRESVKTLYFGIWTKGEIWKATITDEGNKVSNVIKHATVPNWDPGDHHMQCAPNGKLLAIRYGGDVSVVGLNGTSHNKNIGGGCHPSWFSDSKWLYHANSWIGTIDATKAAGEKGGSYHFGSSSNMKWAITITSFGSNAQNNGWPVKYGSVALTMDGDEVKSMTVGKFDSEEVTKKGNWMDIHEFEITPVNATSQVIAPVNFTIDLAGRQLTVNSAYPGTHTIELYRINGVKAKTIQTHDFHTTLSLKGYPEGMYILKVKSGERSAQKEFMIK